MVLGNNMNWSTAWDDTERLQPLPEPKAEHTLIIEQAKINFKECEEWEAQTRLYFEYDYKFANGDTHNKYQWDAGLVTTRELSDRPCLTVNKTQIHNLMVINDARQNKPGVRIRPVGDEASYEGAQIFQELIYHIEYISNAETVYDSATSFQVQAGIGYWRVQVDWMNDKSFDQEIYIRRIKDPRFVYLDPYINEIDGSDATFGFIFDDMPKKQFKKEYPKFAMLANVGSSVLGNDVDGWWTKDTIRICEYYRKTMKEDKLVTWTHPDTKDQMLKRLSEMDDTEKLMYQALKKEKPSWNVWAFRERDILTDNIEWFKIAGDRIIEEGPWLGKYIPIVRLIGTETIIDGILDRKGHTRSLINPQQMYNYNTSASVEFGALQTKSPWVAPSDAIEGFEEYWKTANTENRSYLPYNHIGEDGQVIPPPTRPTAPQASPAYVQQMQVAQNEMMMATGQYQAQLGENENAKSGIAINARQRQGDRITYHFIDNLGIAVRFTGKILIDLIPKIYDTKRVQQIRATDGSILNVTIDPNAKQGFEKINDPTKSPKMVEGRQVQEIIFNPNFGYYDIQSDTGPSFATKRMEAANALTQIASQDKDFIKTGGDVLFEMMDFPKADVLAQRYRRMLPPALLGEGPDPQVEQMMHAASDKIEQLTGLVQQQAKDLADKDRELTRKAQELDLKLKEASAREAREDYRAETERAIGLFNTGSDGSGPAEEVKAVVKQLIQGMLQNGELNFTDDNKPIEKEEEPPMEGAKKAPDNNWYVQHEHGGFSRVEA